MVEQQPRKLSERDRVLLGESEESPDALTRKAWGERCRERLKGLRGSKPTIRRKWVSRYPSYPDAKEDLERQMQRQMRRGY